ncbi:hypothetical protein BBK36DRAFT_1167312 [Trichoderma citrinoviride]|uniref:Pal1-domain-containing protein n=1 Tax=Trichoderma citrinoviride TaxID=58853 RepID=A0A2T4BFD7_9HYPO|nr:hypothetical protein BBK36DRAFT_1167312 [Trichoderma citrinoviride]PTB68026.1 hypothetical protein BBK36DRAFT_1167312 [Trichoderma citrinoviride]
MSLPTSGSQPSSGHLEPRSEPRSQSQFQSPSRSEPQLVTQSQAQAQSASAQSPRSSSTTIEQHRGVNSLPPPLRRSIQPNPSPTSLVSSTAEGKPIPVDDSTVEYRTTALRELNHNFPSHRYAKSTGAQSSTYSEPVIVRSYYPPVPSSRPSSSSRGPVAHGSSVSGIGAGSGSQVSRFAEAVAGVPSRLVSGEHGMLGNMVLSFGKKPVNGRAEDEARLPPVEAFSFKSFMANLEAQGGGIAGDINADLDRIAEICARSRYSLSNQYEVHYTPHGSGTSFYNASAHNDIQGPTLQVVSADDEYSVGASARRRRRMARRNSRAVGTLETIISTSRSSDEEQPGRKKTASEIAEEVRGRTAQKSSSHSSASSSSSGTLDERRDAYQEDAAPKKSSTSLALIDPSTRHTGAAIDSPRTSATGLLEIRTAPGEPHEEPPATLLVKETPLPPKQVGLSVAKGAITHTKTDTAGGGILSMIHGWMPWRPSSTSTHHHHHHQQQQKGLAEGSLRELLKTAEPKGKGHEILQ